MQWTEERIRQYLDGTFTKIDYNGLISTIDVSGDFIPPGTRSLGRQMGQKIAKQAYWTRAEEELLARMRLLNKPFAEIAWVMSRTEDAVKKHYKVMRVKGLVS